MHKSQVEKLEEKLDGLVTLLKSTQESKASNETPVPTSYKISPTSSTSIAPLSAASQSSPEEISGQSWIHLEIANSAAGSQPSATRDEWIVTPDNAPAALCRLPGLCPPIPDRVDFTSDQANILLCRWREHMAPFFPFIVVSPSISAQDLQRDRPFLLKSILAVASHNPGQQLALGKWLVRQLVERMAINGERNLDLLLGLLTYTGW